jgi:L-asparagine transporter-like permease
VLFRNVFAGDDALLPFLLLIIYILIATTSLNLHLKMSYETGNIKRSFFAVLSIVSGLTVIFTLRHILFEKADIMEFTVLIMSFFLLLFSFLKFIEYSSKETK